MNAVESMGWLDSPSRLREAVERLERVRATGIDVGVDFHGRVHKPMARRLVEKGVRFVALFPGAEDSIAALAAFAHQNPSR